MTAPRDDIAREIGLAALRFEQQVTGQAPKSVTVALRGDALVIVRCGALSEAERDPARSPEGAAGAGFPPEVFATAVGALRAEIEQVLGVRIRASSAEIDSSTGTVVRAFVSGTVVWIFLLDGSVPTAVWSRTRSDRSDESDGTDRG